ncbi:cell division protein FtsA [Candidatus Azambacteria bacterium RIFCSPLOWO2_02_FULL_46_11]|uniref:Cell division protein FtsA n=3 Tax=Candidatus Azamiibacteriota TaxID=1752741 RepID=A0A1F5C6U3_9BACT|nr:MAG: cell division protein FtsA [Candidatus Azambacteria bacterium RIFCSPLOWO2_01_FULL_46_26]OGD44679.1 MAG: cell division protein FtsA [Candidatus Azambacteria bacterium RIFCSPLOWO2_02_FULL_46_11]
MKNDIIIGLDIGTSTVQTVVAQKLGAAQKLRILGTGQSSVNGLRRGIITDIDAAARSIREAVKMAERASGVSVREAYVSVGGSHIGCRSSRGVVAVSRADQEISEDDVMRVIRQAEAVTLAANREILHVIPREFIIDSEKGIKDPVGMHGIRLEVDVLIIEGSTPVLKNLNKCLSEAGIEPSEFILSSLASSRAVLNSRQKELGVLTLDLGAGTTGLGVFEDGDIVYANILPIGSGHITNDIAIGLRTSIDVAEKIKLEYGSCAASEIGKKETIDLAKFGVEDQTKVSRRMLADIIEARICEIFDLVNKELKKINRQGMLPAGVILVGGGAKLQGLVDLAKRELKLPAQIGFPAEELGGLVDRVDDPTFACALGLVLMGQDLEGKKEGLGSMVPKIPLMDGSIFDKIKHWFRAILP